LTCVNRRGSALRTMHNAPMAEYPQQLERRRTLADGRAVLIRPIRADDEPREREFFARLSPESRQQRFMKFVRTVPDAMLQYLTHVDYDRHMAFVCEAAAAGGPELVGQARYVANPDGRSCEFAVVVADAWRKSGVAGLLMEALMRTARERGLRSMEGLVLRDNRTMLRFVKALGFEVTPDPVEPTMARVEKKL
jgi:acetyltransferase